VRALAADRGRLAAGADGVTIARKHFDYDMLTRRVEAVLEHVRSPHTSPAGAAVRLR
jgi:hypothetical protein